MKTTNPDILLKKLRTKLTSQKITDDDFYEAEEVADIDPETMFDYFTGALDEQGMARIERFAEQSQVFLTDLIGIGEIVVAGSHVAEVPSWPDVRELASQPLNKLASAAPSLLRSPIRFSLSSLHMAAADTLATGPLSWSLPFGLDARVFEDGDHLVIDLTTRDKTQAGQLLGWSLRNEKVNATGMVLLHLGSSGFVSADIAINRSQFAGDCELNIVPVSFEDLCCSDAELITAAIGRDRDSGIPMEPWHLWRDRLSQSNDAVGLASLLQAVNAVLNG